MREETAIYRGWMMSVSQYQRFHAGLCDRKLRLINSPEQYRHCHHLPESYLVIAGQTPHTVWLRAEDGISLESVRKALSAFGERAVIVKDYVKSQKHYWNEACYIPNAADSERAWKVVSRFLELQDESSVGGLAFREHVELASIGHHERSGMPLGREFRSFWLDGKVVAVFPNWGKRDESGEYPAVEKFAEIASRVQSRFFAMDIAQLADGRWIIMELGDGQVSGLPDDCDVDSFYSRLAILMAD